MSARGTRPAPRRGPLRCRPGIAREEGAPPVPFKQQDEGLVVRRVQFPARASRGKDGETCVPPEDGFARGKRSDGNSPAAGRRGEIAEDSFFVVPAGAPEV